MTGNEPDKEDGRPLKYNLRLRIYKEDKVFGPGVAELLKRVRETGSLKEACRSMDMAYSKAWKIVKRSEADFGFPLMIGTRGGSDGGRTVLTREGEDLLERYTAMQQKLNETAGELFELYFK